MSHRGSQQVFEAALIRQDDDLAKPAGLQLRAVADRLIRAGQHRISDAPITVGTDAGYDFPHPVWKTRAPPVIIVDKLQSDWVLYDKPWAYARTGCPPQHGRAFRKTDPAVWGEVERALPLTEPRTPNQALGCLAAPWRWNGPTTSGFTGRAATYAAAADWIYADIVEFENRPLPSPGGNRSWVNP